MWLIRLVAVIVLRCLYVKVSLSIDLRVEEGQTHGRRSNELPLSIMYVVYRIGIRWSWSWPERSSDSGHGRFWMW